MKRHLLGLLHAESECLRRLACAKGNGQSERVCWEQQRLLSLHDQIAQVGATL